MTQKTKKIEQDLQQREKSERIKLMLGQQPDLAWVLQTPLPVAGKGASSINADLYRNRINKAVAAAEEHYRDRKYQKTLENTLTALSRAWQANLPHQRIILLRSLSVTCWWPQGSSTTSPLRLAISFFRRACSTASMHLISASLRPKGTGRYASGLSSRSLRSASFPWESFLELGEDISDLPVGNHRSASLMLRCPTTPPCQPSSACVDGATIQMARLLGRNLLLNPVLLSENRERAVGRKGGRNCCCPSLALNGGSS